MLFGPVAQLGERTVRIRKVVGSNPFRSTKKIRDTRKVYIAKTEVGYQTSRSGNDNICTQCQTSFLLFEQNSVITAIHCHTGNRHEVGEALHLLVYLLCQLTGRSHDNAIDSIGRVSAL